MSHPSSTPQIVSLLAPYDHIGSPQLGPCLVQAFQLKLAGYRDVYDYGVLPLDTYDFISTHHLLGFSTDGVFKPAMAFRTLELDKCEQHGLPFPGVAVLQNSGADLHVKVLREHLLGWKGQRVSYASSWAMAPELREDREMRDLLRDMMVTMLINHELDRKSDHRLLCGVPKVRTDRLFEKLGYSRVRAGVEHLPPFRQGSLMGEEAVLLECQKFSDEALRIAEAHRELWDNRRVIGLPSSADTEKQAA